MTLFLWMSSR